MEIFKNMKKLFGHETVDYSEKIPNKLASDDFDVHHVSLIDLIARSRFNGRAVL